LGPENQHVTRSLAIA